MTFQEITELIKALSRSRLAEFKLKDGDFELSIKTDRYGETKAPKVVQTPLTVAAPASVVSTPPPATPAAPAPTAAPVPAEAPAPTADPKKAADEKKYLEIKSPMVGTFYRSGSPENPPFVEVGSSVKAGDVVCIIEAMKLFNELESEISGKIVKVMVENSKPVEYDQVLFLVEPE